MVAKLWTSRGSTSTGPPADTDQMIHAAPSEVTYKIYIRSQPRRSVHQVQDQHRALHRRTGTGPLLHHPPLHLPRSPPSDPQPYTDELVQVTGLQASIGSQPLHCDDVYIYIYMIACGGQQHPPSSPRPYTDELVQVTGLQAKATNSHKKTHTHIHNTV